MEDKYNRNIDYLRISVTDLCNLRCIYCIPEEGVPKVPHKEILSYEEITLLARIFAEEFGIRKIRITGGEPLVRPSIENLIYMLNSISSLKEITLTTNGVILQQKAKILKKAGLKRLNISLDTLNPEIFNKITRRNDLQKVLNGIDEALTEGFFPIKINTVVMNGINNKEIPNIIKYAIEKGMEIRLIEFMNLGGKDLPFHISNKIIKESLKKDFEFTKIEENSIITEDYLIKARGQKKETKIGFISPISNMFCNKCNRIRLKATGEILSCLMNSRGYRLKDPLRKGNLDIVRNIINKSISEKSLHHPGSGKIPMYTIGG